MRHLGAIPLITFDCRDLCHNWIDLEGGYGIGGQKGIFEGSVDCQRYRPDY
jgi:hypothetical protein